MLGAKLTSLQGSTSANPLSYAYQEHHRGWTTILLYFREAGPLQRVKCVELDSGRESYLLVRDLCPACFQNSASHGKSQPVALDDEFLNEPMAE